MNMRAVTTVGWPPPVVICWYNWYNNFNYYTLRLNGTAEDRDNLRKHLDSKGIGTAVYYPLSLHLQEVYKSLGYRPGDFPQSERAQAQVISLPMYPELKISQVERVAAAVREYYSQNTSR